MKVPMTVDNLHCMCVSTNPKDRWFRLAARYHWVWVRRDADARLSHHVLYLRRG